MTFERIDHIFEEPSGSNPKPPQLIRIATHSTFFTLKNFIKSFP